MKKQLEELCGVNLSAYYFGRNEAYLKSLEKTICEFRINITLKNTLSFLFGLIKSDMQFSKIVATASPLLWSNCYLLLGQDQSNTIAVEKNIILITLHLLDCFLKQPDEIEISFEIYHDFFFYFSSLDRAILLKKGHITLKKIKNKFSIISKTHQEDFLCLSAVSKPMALINLPIYDLPEQFIESIDQSCETESFSSVLLRAMENISYMDFILYKNIVEWIHLFFVIKLPENITETEKSHYSVSFSTQEYLGVIFLSTMNNLLWLSETVVHEYSHNLLNILMLARNLVKTTEKVFYSPWKQELRPASALLHALFSITCAAVFMEKYLHTNLSNDEVSFIKNRLLTHAHRINYGFMQNMNEHLTELGKKVHDLIKDYFYSSNLVSFLGIDCPKNVSHHYKAYAL